MQFHIKSLHGVCKGGKEHLPVLIVSKQHNVFVRTVHHVMPGASKIIALRTRHVLRLRQMGGNGVVNGVRPMARTRPD